MSKYIKYNLITINNDFDIEQDYVYVNNLELRKHKVKGLNRLVKIKGGNGIIIRKMVGRNLTSSKAALSYSNMNIIGNKIGEEIEVKPANLFEKLVKYYIYHPKEEIRLTYYIFLITALLTIITIL